MRSSQAGWLLLAVAVLAAGCGGSSEPATGTVSGKVLVDGAPVQGQEVLLQGASQLLTATTGADGRYHLPDVPEGTYVLSVDVASTLERHAQVAVSVKAPVAVPDLTFQGVASLTGTVTDATGAPVLGAQVQVLGTQVAGSTDGDGRFVFSSIPTGTRTVAVTSDAGSAQAQVTLARGDTQDVTLGLAARPPATPATITGQAGFFARTDLSLIEVSIPAAGVSTHADPDGHYSLSVPRGDWDVFARAPYYPSQKLGHVSVASGQSVSLPQTTLSLYTDLPTFGVQGGVWGMASQVGFAPRTAVLLTLRQAGTAVAYYAFNLEHRTLKLVSVSTAPWLSPDGRWALMNAPSGGLLFLNVETSENFKIPASGSVSFLSFSSDGTQLLVKTNGASVLYVVKLADHTVTQLPDYGEVHAVASDRLLVRTTDAAPYVWKLVTPSGISTAFTNVSSVQLAESGAASTALAIFGVEDCATPPCALDVLGPTATTAVATSWLPSSTSFTVKSSAANWLLMGVGDGTQRALIDTTSGAVTLLQSGASDFRFSTDGSRLAYTVLGTQLFEHALPFPNPTTLTPVVTSAGAMRESGYVSASRFVGYDDTPVSGAAYRFTLDSGVFTQDRDYTVNSGWTSVYATWLAADGKARFSLGEGPIHTAPEGQTTVPPNMEVEFQLHSTSLGFEEVAGTRMAVSWQDGETWLFDGDAAPRALPVSLMSGAYPFFSDLMQVLDEGHAAQAMDSNSAQLLALHEPGRDVPVQDASLQAPLSLLVTHSLDATGAPVGGAYAVLPQLILF